MLKLKINQAQYDALDPSLKALYTSSGTDHVLNVEVDTQIATLTGEVSKLNADIVKLNGDVTTMTTTAESRKDFVDPLNIPDIATVQKQLDDEKLASATSEANYQSMISTNMIADRGRAIATEVFKAPGVTKRLVEDRLIVDFASGVGVLKVKGADGKPSDTTFEALTKELRENKDNSEIVIGSKAKGGDLPKAPGTPGYVPQPSTNKPVDLKTASSADLVTMIKEKKAAAAEAAAA